MTNRRFRPNLSTIAGTLNNTKYNGNSFLDNVSEASGDENRFVIQFIIQVFNAYPDDLNVITFLLSRNDSITSDGGDFTIGECANIIKWFYSSVELSP
jgi:hypothetical protein